MEKAVDHALALTDLERAEWSLNSGDASAARFYATQATLSHPGWRKAENLVKRAEAEVARQRRRALASAQVGYPDRSPRVDLAALPLLRGLLAGSQTENGDSTDA